RESHAAGPGAAPPAAIRPPPAPARARAPDQETPTPRSARPPRLCGPDTPRRAALTRSRHPGSAVPPPLPTAHTGYSDPPSFLLQRLNSTLRAAALPPQSKNWGEARRSAPQARDDGRKGGKAPPPSSFTIQELREPEAHARPDVHEDEADAHDDHVRHHAGE